MRTDEKVEEGFRKSEDWQRDPVSGRALAKRYEMPVARRGTMSLSGHEHNHLFLGDGGASFRDISGVSGLDSDRDGRSFAVWDFDRDGWLDLALVNANAPLLNLFRNRIGGRQRDGSEPGRTLAVRLVGGNRSATASSEYSNRDGYGARVTVRAGGRTLMRELHCGEGLAAQNSHTLVIGIGNADRIEQLDVRWPSGKQQQLQGVDAGTLVTVFENAAESRDGAGFDREPYLRASSTSDPVDRPARRLGVELGVEVAGRLAVFTSMATWCSSCKRHLPQLAELRSRFDAADVGLFGVPVDETDGAEQLAAYVADHEPAYAMLAELPGAQRREFAAAVEAALSTTALPASVITDRELNVLEVVTGVPTVSELAELLAARR